MNCNEQKEGHAKWKCQSIPLDVKMQVLDLLEKGEHQVNIGVDLKLPTSTIRTILRNTEIKSSATNSTATSAKNITQARCYIQKEMEKRLSIWMNNMPLSQAIIMEKARSIYGHIQRQTTDVTESFSASRCLFDCFKKRNKLYNIKITGEAAIADTLKLMQSFQPL
ncbi:putative CENPB DNA-binding domain-containing protein 1 [Discoglossus pictus]